MVHVHGILAQELSSRTAGVALDRLVAVPIDVGKSSAMAMACDFTGRRLLGPFEFAMNRNGVARLVKRVRSQLPRDVALVRAGVEACGHYPGRWSRPACCRPTGRWSSSTLAG